MSEVKLDYDKVYNLITDFTENLNCYYNQSTSDINKDKILYAQYRLWNLQLWIKKHIDELQ